MKMRRLIALVAAALLLATLACASAEGAGAPKIKGVTYNNGDSPTAAIEYDDPAQRDWIEVYLLKEGEVEPNMGTQEVDGKLYSIIGIQTINPQDPNVYTVREDGTTVLNTDFYFGDGQAPEPGEEVFLTVGLTGEDGEEALGELVPITVPEKGESLASAPAAAE